MTPARRDGDAWCTSCGAPLAHDQRYCLHCGARHGAPRVDPLEALGFGVLEPPAAAPGPGPARRPRPSRRTAAALAGAALVLGGLAGAAIGPAPAPSVAAAPARVIALVTPAPAPVTTTDTAPTEPEAPPSSDDTPTPGATHATSTDPTPAAGGDSSGTADATPEDSAGDNTDAGAPSASTPSSATPATTTTPAAVPHVWIVSLTGLDVTSAFGPESPLADLVAQGTLLRGYTPAGPTSAANVLALLGGVVPTQDCAADIAACTLGPSEPSLPGQLTGAGLRWHAYVEDPATRCTGPNGRIGVSLFHALADSPDCAKQVTGLETLPVALATEQATPALSLVVPAATTLDATTSPALHDLLAKITASPAYRNGGIVLLTVDAPPAPTDPAAPLPAVGTLVLSPRATAGQATDTVTGPVNLLRSLEQLFVVPALGAAAQTSTGALDGVLAPATATASSTTPSSTTPPTATTASVFPHRSTIPNPTRRSP